MLLSPRPSLINCAGVGPGRTRRLAANGAAAIRCGELLRMLRSRHHRVSDHSALRCISGLRTVQADGDSFYSDETDHSSDFDSDDTSTHGSETSGGRRGRSGRRDSDASSVSGGQPGGGSSRSPSDFDYEAADDGYEGEERRAVRRAQRRWKEDQQKQAKGGGLYAAGAAKQRKRSSRQHRRRSDVSDGGSSVGSVKSTLSDMVPPLSPKRFWSDCVAI